MSGPFFSGTVQISDVPFVGVLGEEGLRLLPQRNVTAMHGRNSLNVGLSQPTRPS